MRSVLALAAFLLVAPPLAAQSGIRTEIDTAAVTVGDRITMRVTVEHPAGARVEWPDSVHLDPFEVLGSHLGPAEAPGDTTSSAELTLTAFHLGDLEIPSFDVPVAGPDGSEQVLHTDSFTVHVASVGGDDSGDIRDIHGPLGLPMSTLRMVLWLVLPLVAVALLYTLARRLRPKKGGESRAALGPLARPPHEVALEALDVLEASPLLGSGQVKAYHIEVSDILRSYVEGRFGVDALEMTTVEVLAGLERACAPERFRDGLSAFLAQCDMVKFAKVRPAPDQCRQVLELGRRLVLDTVPSSEPAEEGEGDEGELTPAGGAPEAEPASVGDTEGSS